MFPRNPPAKAETMWDGFPPDLGVQVIVPFAFPVTYIPTMVDARTFPTVAVRTSVSSTSAVLPALEMLSIEATALLIVGPTIVIAAGLVPVAIIAMLPMELAVESVEIVQVTIGGLDPL